MNNMKGVKVMITAKEVAKYFLFKDKDRKLFNTNLVEFNNRRSYEGNIRLNKYLYCAQTVYLAKNGVLLFNDNFVAYDNGPVIKEIVENYASLQATIEAITLPKEITTFLDKIYLSLEDATCEELIEITHEDTAWKELSGQTFYAPVIDLLKYKAKFEKQYKGLIKVMEI